MKTIATAVSVVLILSIVGLGQTPASGPANATARFLGAQDQWARCGATAVDQNFFNDGTIIRVDGSGPCIVRIITGKGQQEKRFVFKLSVEESLALRKVFIDADFVAIPPSQDRKATMGEHRPRITLRNADGNTCRQMKWSNDAQESFDKVYGALFGLQKKAEGLTTDYEGKYQPDWTPTSAPVSQPARERVSLSFETHDGYFVSNKFEPNAPESFAVLRTQAAFDEVLGAGHVMNDKSRRLPADAFESKMVLAAVHWGKGVWEYAVQEVTVEKGVLTIRYTATSKASDSAEFACPLIVSVERDVKDNYAAVEFVENGKLVKRIGAAAASRPARP